ATWIVCASACFRAPMPATPTRSPGRSRPAGQSSAPSDAFQTAPTQLALATQIRTSLRFARAAAVVSVRRGLGDRRMLGRSRAADARRHREPRLRDLRELRGAHPGGLVQLPRVPRTRRHGLARVLARQAPLWGHAPDAGSRADAALGER